MAEWFKAAVLKTAERKLRGFESYSLRHAYKLSWRGGRVAEGSRLLSGWSGKTGSEVRILSSPPA